MKHSAVSISFSGLTLRFRFPEPVQLPQELLALQCPDCLEADVEFEVCLLDAPLRPDGFVCTADGEIEIYKLNEGWLRIFPALTWTDGCQVACLLPFNGKNKLYYPAARWDFYAAELHLLHLIGAEVWLLQHNAFLLHSSVVTVEGKAILFSGPSGAGKSTQADLWAQYRGAEILNGDRCLILEQDGIFYGGGSPWCGTSGIRKPGKAPIAGIFLVEKAPENRLERLGLQAFLPLFTQTVVNSWDETFMARITALFGRLLAQIPVYRLYCRPEEAAVSLVYNELFRKGEGL